MDILTVSIVLASAAIIWLYIWEHKVETTPQDIYKEYTPEQFTKVRIVKGVIQVYDSVREEWLPWYMVYHTTIGTTLAEEMYNLPNLLPLEGECSIIGKAVNSDYYLKGGVLGLSKKPSSSK